MSENHMQTHFYGNFPMPVEEDILGFEICYVILVYITDYRSIVGFGGVAVQIITHLFFLTQRADKLLKLEKSCCIFLAKYPSEDLSSIQYMSFEMRWYRKTRARDQKQTSPLQNI